MTRFAQALDAEISDLEAELGRDPKFLKLHELKRVRELYRSNLPTTLGMVAGDVVPASPRQFSGRSLDALNAAKTFLNDKIRPVSTTEILRHLNDLDITFGGERPQNTLSSILSKSPDFKANGRSGWTLNKEKADGVSVG